MKSNVFCLLILLITSSYAYSQERIAAFEMNQRLGRGINMGNAFEAPTETAWGNPWKPEYFEKMAELGFQHVRLPIQWETSDRSLATAPYTITETFLARIREVVDLALENDLIIIINMHHHELLFNDPAGQKERFLSQWGQISQYFKDYPEELIFEVLNEPHGNLNPQLWNEYFSDALEIIRETNPDRMVLMGTAEYGGLGGLSHLQLPDDENIIVSVHYYNPFPFTHQGAEWVGTDADAWLGTEWKDTEAERETIINEFAPALAFSAAHKVPIHVGEFGAYSKADLDSRVLWTTFLARWFEEQNLSWAYWEFNSGFGIYNPATDQMLQPLLDALLHNEMPDPVGIEVIPIYKSDFTDDADGWNLQVQSGLNATLSAGSGKLLVSITDGGSVGWHVQLFKNNLPLYQGKMYRITVQAAASDSRNTTTYAGKASDPWNSYSGYNSLSLTSQVTTYTITFNMSDATDLEARLVFDLGNSNVDVEIIEVKLEEIRIAGTEEPEEPLSIDWSLAPSLHFYPNPVHSLLKIKNATSFSKALLFDLFGRKLEVFPLSDAEVTLNLEKYPPGKYIFLLEGYNEIQSRFVILKY